MFVETRVKVTGFFDGLCDISAVGIHDIHICIISLIAHILSHILYAYLCVQETVDIYL